jgi:alkylation response protein AidB-like acyl-CoA dehydrogenase
MDFATTPVQDAFIEAVDRFVAQHLPPEEVRRRDHAHVPPYDLLPAMGEAGFFRIALPEDEGGLGEDWRSLALVQERFGAHAYMAASILNRVVGFGITSVRGYGSAAQRTAYLPRLLAGRMLIALALTEPGAGSDAAAVTTRAARLPGGGWRITGRKSWISDARGADLMLVVARTAPGSTGAEGISLLLVPPAAPGMAMTELPKIGNNCMPSYDIAFDGVEVPEEALMGEEGRGFRHLMSTLHASRASMAATVTGAAEGALGIALDHARTRIQFGRPIGANQAIRHRLAEMRMRVDASRLTVRHLAWLIATGQPCRREAAQAKIIATECLQFVTDGGMQITASAGYAAESDIGRLWRDARLYSFGEGANEILRDGVAREMGL